MPAAAQSPTTRSTSSRVTSQAGLPNVASTRSSRLVALSTVTWLKPRATQDAAYASAQPAWNRPGSAAASGTAAAPPCTTRSSPRIDSPASINQVTPNLHGPRLQSQRAPEQRVAAGHGPTRANERVQVSVDLRCNRQLHNLPELQDKARAINARLLDTETVGQGTALVSPVIERITRPTVTDGGRKAPAPRFGDLRVQALAGAIAAMLFTVTGITNKTLRGLMTGLLHRPYSMNQASYDLSRLARNGLIERVPGRNRYTLTRDGLLFAHFYTKVYDHVLRPLMAPVRPNAPPELAAALDTLDRLTADHIARARVPTAA